MGQFNSELKIALGDTVQEDMPLELVHYPDHYRAFIGFSKTESDKQFLCLCQKVAMENYLNLQSKRAKTESTPDPNCLSLNGQTSTGIELAFQEGKLPYEVQAELTRTRELRCAPVAHSP